MLSGNGRHRRPRQAPALLVAAGVTGSAIAIPLLGATGASAASGTTWDAVAECESGGSWSANSGNGYYGGLQMTQETWEDNGGLDYAPSADQASRSQQIAVAEKILAKQGTSAWATCGLVAGLTQNSDSADSDTGGAEESPTPLSGLGMGDSSSGTKSDTSGSSSSSDTSSGSGDSADSQDSDSSSTDATAKSDDPDKSSQNGEASAEGSGTEDTGFGRHRGDSADEGATDSRADDSAGRHASRSDSESRVAAEGSYAVRSGDSLWGIADSLGVEGGWRALYAENKEAIGDDPDFIIPGQSLDVDGLQTADK
ncbi:transglycosylase family protein [Streptomyces phaeochromogenes]|uniref:transglycosylase family protein n=1 Tax=Streptomyces phaeochromogenes TaxID=1923 RepID=UPI002E146D2C|nr:transglycosylase family protein [Streptomyces phaeochromogenes]WSJ07474.1 transglycosylase family protein [Streptomyces phaeochromogenes]